MEDKTIQEVKKANSIFIFGGLWFDKVNGNTYHATKCITDNGYTFYIRYQYGYGNSYYYDAVEVVRTINNTAILIDAGCAYFKQRDLKNYNF